MHCQVNEREYRCHCLHLSEAMVVSMAAATMTSWQYTNDDEERALNLHCGVQQEFMALLQRRRETRGRDRAVISEVDLNQLLHRNREVSTKVELSGERE